MLGIYIGNYLRKTKDIRKSGERLIKVGVIFLIIFLIATLILAFDIKNINITSNKYPPTLYHFVYSISFCFVTLGIFFALEKFSFNLFNLLIPFGQNSLMVYLFHWILIRIFIYLGFATYQPLLAGVLSVILAYLGALLNYKLKLI